MPVIATCTSAARMVWQEEMDESFGSSLAQWQESPNFSYYPIGDLKAPIASGTTRIAGMVVIPCSTGTDCGHRPRHGPRTYSSGPRTCA